MPLAAITYRAIPGNEDAIAEIFGNFQRADTTELRDESGAVVGQLLGTAVFIKDDVVVRVIHYEGDIRQVGRHMATQQGVRALEQKLAPYLAQQRDSQNVEGFRGYFAASLMRPISLIGSFDPTPVPTPAVV
jgi:hypothetical protein